MPGTVILTGPPAPPGSALGWCAVCAGLGKQAALAADRDAVTEHEARGQGVRAWALDIPPEFAVAAVAWGVYLPLQAALPLCWTHLAGLDNRASGIILAAPGVPFLGDGRPRP